MKFQSAKDLARKINHPKFEKRAFLTRLEDKDLTIMRLVQSKFHSEAFYLRFKKFVKNLDEVVSNPSVDLKIGDLVAYTNENGCTFPNNKVLGFANNSEYGRVVYLDSSSYWFASRIDELTLQDGYVGVEESDLLAVEEKYKNSPIPYDLQMLRLQEA